MGTTAPKQHTNRVFGVVEAPSKYNLKGWKLFLDEGAEIISPQHMAHEVRPHGHQERRRNTTLRAWVATGEAQAKLAKSAVQSQEQLMQEMHAMGWWKFRRLSAGDWMAARCRRVGTKHKDHFRRATAQLERDSVREGRVIWQCGPKIDFKISRVR